MQADMIVYTCKKASLFNYRRPQQASLQALTLLVGTPGVVEVLSSTPVAAAGLTKSPPAVVHGVSPSRASFQVLSPALAGAPCPLLTKLVPSPNAVVRRWKL